MTYFEPPTLPRSGTTTPHERAALREPADPYAPPPRDGWGEHRSAPAAPWGPPAQLQHPRGTPVLVLGILSVTLVQLLGPVAWVTGRRALREIDRSGRTYANRSSIQAGMILGIIGTALAALAAVWLSVVIAAVIAGI